MARRHRRRRRRRSSLATGLRKMTRIVRRVPVVGRFVAPPLTASKDIAGDIIGTTADLLNEELRAAGVTTKKVLNLVPGTHKRHRKHHGSRSHKHRRRSHGSRSHKRHRHHRRRRGHGTRKGNKRKHAPVGARLGYDALHRRRRTHRKRRR